MSQFTFTQGQIKNIVCIPTYRAKTEVLWQWRGLSGAAHTGCEFGTASLIRPLWWRLQNKEWSAPMPQDFDTHSTWAAPHTATLLWCHTFGQGVRKKRNRPNLHELWDDMREHTKRERGKDTSRNIPVFKPLHHDITGSLCSQSDNRTSWWFYCWRVKSTSGFGFHYKSHCF